MNRQQTALGTVAAICRYPVKSLVGEDLDSAAVDDRGLVGDRLWAVHDLDGKLGSGKSTRRFRRMPGLLELTASYDQDLLPVVGFPDGRRVRGDSAEIHEALSAHVGRPVSLASEKDISHFDEGPLHLVTTGSITRLSELHGSGVDVRRLRANVVVDTGGHEFDEAGWVDRTLAIGTEVVVRVREPMVRCVMVGLPQVGLDADPHLLNTIGTVNDVQLGLVVDVSSPGTVRVGDAVCPA